MSPMRLFDPVPPNEPNSRTFREELLSPVTFMSLLAILAILDVRDLLRWWLVPVLAGLAVLGAWGRTHRRQGADARAELREGLVFLQRQAWAMVPLAVLVVVATWPVPDDTLHKGVVPAGLLTANSAIHGRWADGGVRGRQGSAGRARVATPPERDPAGEPLQQRRGAAGVPRRQGGRTTAANRADDAADGVLVHRPPRQDQPGGRHGGTSGS